LLYRLSYNLIEGGSESESTRQCTVIRSGGKAVLRGSIQSKGSGVSSDPDTARRGGVDCQLDRGAAMAWASPPTPRRRKVDWKAGRCSESSGKLFAPIRSPCDVAVEANEFELNEERRRSMADDRGWASGCLAVFGLLLSVAYLSNITMGLIEIPDNLPLIGNLDEVFFSGVLFASLARLGINLPVGQRRTLIQPDANKTRHESGEARQMQTEDQTTPPHDKRSS